MTCSTSIYSHGDRKGMQDVEKKWLQVLSVSDWVLCSTQGYILDSTRLSGRVFVGADITKYGPLEEITCSYQEAWWSFTITDEPIVAAFCAGAFWNINCHTFPFCIRKLPRKLTVVLLFSLATPHPPTLFPHPPTLFFPTHIFVGGVETHLYRLHRYAHLVSARFEFFHCTILFLAWLHYSAASNVNNQISSTLTCTKSL